MDDVHTKADQIDLARLYTLRAGVKLEHKGLRKSGPSCTAITKRMLGLPVSATYPVVMGKLEAKIKESENALDS